MLTQVWGSTERQGLLPTRTPSRPWTRIKLSCHLHAPKEVIGKDLASDRVAALSPSTQRRQLGLKPTGQEGSH